MTERRIPKLTIPTHGPMPLIGHVRISNTVGMQVGETLTVGNRTVGQERDYTITALVDIGIDGLIDVMIEAVA